MGLLDGKVALITGAGGGLGEAYAKLFAREGASVVVNDLGGPRDGSGADKSMAQLVVDAIKADGGKAVANGADISTMEGGQSVFDDAIKHFGRADILVNNAGILRDQTFAKASESDWDKVIKVHLKGTFCCTMPVFRWMRENGRWRHRQHLLDIRADRQFRSDQLRRGQGRHLGPVQRAGDRGPEVQHPDLDAGAGRADPHDRRPAPL
ncbi:NAD(P)-dependent dehydrogenase (short-subunit alcohol dehydrogenase family) [Bradyrhizobium sp. S3.14.4]